MADKRKEPPTAFNGGGLDGASALVKRQRQANDADGTMQIAIASSKDGKNKGLVRSVKRTSSLSAPIISLAGAHGVSHYTVISEQAWGSY